MLTPAVRGAVVYMHTLFGVSKSVVARALHVSRSSVQKILKKKQVTKKYARKCSKRSTRIRKILKKLVMETATVNGRTYPVFGSARQLAEGLFQKSGLALGTRQVTRHLHAVHLTPYVRRPAPTREPKEVERRVAFAKKMLKEHPSHSFWKRLVFSDETWVSTSERSTRVQWAANRQQVFPTEKKCRWNIPSAQIWTCCGVNWRGPVVFFPAKRVHPDGDTVPFRLDSARYIRKCLALVAPEMARRRSVYVQDGAKAHSSAATRRYLNRKHVDVVGDWPSSSPDLNCMEMIWNDLKRGIGRRHPSTLQELEAAATAAWAEIPSSVLNNHVLSFRAKLAALVKKERLH